MKDFLKNNLILVILAAAVLVAAAVMLGVGFSVAADVSKKAEECRTAWNDAEHMRPVNPKMLDALKTRIDLVDKEHQKVEAILAGQARQYPVLEVTDSQGKSQKAFPYDRGRYESLGLTLKFTACCAEKWGDTEGGWLRRLGSTRPPTDDDPALLAKVRSWQNRLLDHKKSGLEYISSVLANTLKDLEPKLKQPKTGEAGARSETRPSEEAITGPLGQPEPGEPIGGMDFVPGRGISGAAGGDLAQRAATMRTMHDREIRTLLKSILRAQQVTGQIKDFKTQLGQASSLQRRQELTDLIRQYEEGLAKALGEIETADAAFNSKVANVFDLEPRVATTPAPGDGATGKPDRTDSGISDDFKKMARTYLQGRISISQAMAYAWPEALIAAAKSGRIYAGPEALDLVYPAGVLQASPASLWKMQINAWVTEDILEAIGKTNDDVLAPLLPDNRNVIHSAVKRLVQIDVDENYYLGKDTAGRGPLPPSMLFPPEPGVGGPAGQSARPQSAERVIGQSLTGRVCDREYDVIHYSFTVVMPHRRVCLLVNNLMQGKMHTVLKVEAGTLENVRLAVAPGSTLVRPMDANRYYYGPEPVMAVTLHGELLLRTDWSRDLMPLDALQEQLGRYEPALRKEDSERLANPK